MRRWEEQEVGVGQASGLGRRPMAKAGGHYRPTEADVREACTFRGRVDERAAAALRGGNFSMKTTSLVASTIVHQWQPSTRAQKLGYVKKFLAYARSTGRQHTFFPEVSIGQGTTPVIVVNPVCYARLPAVAEEEQMLCEFAALRVMAGGTLDSTAGVISHIRTWTRVVLVREFGAVGEGGRKSLTSQYLKALEGAFPPENSKDKRRAPFTWPMIELFHEAAVRMKWRDPGVAVAVAFAGLFRMGELTASETRPYDAVVDLAEKDVEFLPSFWNANRVRIQLGVSKADRRGKKSLLRPRILPVEVG
jgi:hypothetical protein